MRTLIQTPLAYSSIAPHTPTHLRGKTNELGRKAALALVLVGRGYGLYHRVLSPES
jgi:hypothetical protein